MISIHPSFQRTQVEISNLCCLPADSGSGNNPQARYYYDCLGGFCDSFVYYGLGGNSNNFETLSQCRRYCSVF